MAVVISSRVIAIVSSERVSLDMFISFWCCVVGHVLSAGEAEVDGAAAAAHAMLHPAPGVMSPGYPKPTPLPPRYAGARAAACPRTNFEVIFSLGYGVQASQMSVGHVIKL